MVDLLYTCNFTLLVLGEAYAATGDQQYREMADRLAEVEYESSDCRDSGKDLQDALLPTLGRPSPVAIECEATEKSQRSYASS